MKAKATDLSQWGSHHIPSDGPIIPWKHEFGRTEGLPQDVGQFVSMAFEKGEIFLRSIAGGERGIDAAAFHSYNRAMECEDILPTQQRPVFCAFEIKLHEANGPVSVVIESGG